MTLNELTERMRELGAQRFYGKIMGTNNNSKQQVYLSGGFDAINMLPVSRVEAIGGKGHFYAWPLFFWLTPSGDLDKAPRAKMILYPRYPEVRFSGFLQGTSSAPNAVMTSKSPGRPLVFGVCDDGRIIGYADEANSELAKALSDVKTVDGGSAIFQIPIASQNRRTGGDIFKELADIARKGWIHSIRLSTNGLVPCETPKCVGDTLEASLGVQSNGKAGPDKYGWEVKAVTVTSFDAEQGAKQITLMTPEPDGGFYHSQGAASFVKRYGYQDTKGRPNRTNFGGIHRVGRRNERTGLSLELSGFDVSNRKILNAAGDLRLVDCHGHVAASWSFSKLIEHWSKKHARAVYVPAECRKDPLRYRYGNRVVTGIGTDALALLSALASGIVVYDPGIKLERSGKNEFVKKRSQFRISYKNLGHLYHTCIQRTLT
jgi:hypothetical protein